MIRIVLVALWLGFAFSTLGQTQPNPFDLHYRHQQRITSSLPAEPKPKIDSLANKSPVSGQKAVLTPDPEIENKTDSSSFDIRKDSVANMYSNPFEMGKLKTSDSTAFSSDESAEVIHQGSKDTSPAFLSRPVSKGIQIFFILFSLLFLIFIVNVEQNFVKDLWRVISNENYSSLHLRNQRNTMKQILLIMGYMIFIFQAGTFIYHVISIFDYKGKILDNIWACIAFVLVVYIVRHAMIRYLRWLFNNEREMTLFGFDIIIFNIMVGLVLLPINILLNFGPDYLAKPLIIIGLIAIVLAYLTRQLRWLLTARQLIARSLFLFFVYLCAIEILPLLAISKFFW